MNRNPTTSAGDAVTLFPRAALLTHRWEQITARLRDVSRALHDPARREWAQRYRERFAELAPDLRREIVAHNAECDRLGNFGAKVDVGMLPGW